MSQATSSNCASKDLQPRQLTPNPNAPNNNQTEIPSHQINEIFMTHHNLEPAVKIHLHIDNIHHDESIHPYNNLDTLAKIKHLIQSPSISLSITERFEVKAVHIDSFKIEVTNRHGQRLSSDNTSKLRQRNGTGTKYSRETFDALMRAVCARVSVGHDYCACGQTAKCEGAKRMPELNLFLSKLNANNKRVRKHEPNGDRQGGGLQRVDPDKVVPLYDPNIQSTSESSIDEEMQTAEPKVMINASCLRRLVHSGNEKKFGRPEFTSESEIGSRKRQRTSTSLSVVSDGIHEVTSRDDAVIHDLDSSSEGGDIEYGNIEWKHDADGWSADGMVRFFDSD